MIKFNKINRIFEILNDPYKENVSRIILEFDQKNLKWKFNEYEFDNGLEQNKNQTSERIFKAIREQSEENKVNKKKQKRELWNA